MSKWSTVRLGDLYSVHNGLSKSREYFGSGYPFIAFKDVFNNFFLPRQFDGLVQTTTPEQDSYSVKRGDVLITRTSETYDELGMSSVALCDYPHATYNGFCKRLRPVTDSVLPEFIGYYLRTPQFRNEFQKFSSMTTRASLKNENLLSMQITLPPMPEQRRISDILFAYDELIEDNRRQIELLEEAAPRLYKEWFIDFKFPGCENVAIIDGLPEGWKTVSASKFAEISIGKTPSRKISEYFCMDGVPWASVRDLGNACAFIAQTSESLTNEAIDVCNVKIVPEGTILLSFKLTVGRVSIAMRPMATNEAIAHFKYSDPTLREYLFEYLSSFHYSRLGSTSSISVAINSSIVKAMPIVVPNAGVLSDFHYVCGPLFDQIKALVQQTSLLSEARNRLLPKLMSGEIEV